MLHEEGPSTPGEQDCESRQLIDLTKQVDASGRLNWNAPAGAWTVLRLGYTLLGAKTKCASPGAQGLEIDFFSAQAMDLHFAETAEKLIAAAGLGAAARLGDASGVGRTVLAADRRVGV